MYGDDHSTTNIQVANLVNGQIRRSLIDSHSGNLPLRMPHSAPKAHTDMFVRKGKAAANNGSPANALSSFVSIMENGNIAHSILNDTDVNENEVASLLSADTLDVISKFCLYCGCYILFDRRLVWLRTSSRTLHSRTPPHWTSSHSTTPYTLALHLIAPRLTAPHLRMSHCTSPHLVSLHRTFIIATFITD